MIGPSGLSRFSGTSRCPQVTVGRFCTRSGAQSAEETTGSYSRVGPLPPPSPESFDPSSVPPSVEVAHRTTAPRTARPTPAPTSTRRRGRRGGGRAPGGAPEVSGCVPVTGCGSEETLSGPDRTIPWSSLAITVTTGVGSESPLRVRSPRSTKLKPVARLPTRDATSAWARVRPSPAASHSRAASTTGVPNQSPSSSSTSPTLTPTLSSSGSSGSKPCAIECIVAAHSRALTVLRWNTAMRPSPSVLTTNPSEVLTAPSNRANRRLRWSSARTSPSRTWRAVEPTTSQNSTATVALGSTTLLEQSIRGRDNLTPQSSPSA